MLKSQPSISLAPPRALSSLRTAWRDSLAIFLAGRVFYSLIGYLIWLTGIRPPEADQFYGNITPVLDGPAGALLGMWQRWDGIHYQSIASQGYSADYLTAFFPLYPMLGRALSWLTGIDILPALILVSNLALLFSLVLLHGMVSDWYNPRLARAALVSLVMFPTAFFLYAIYPQSLILMGSLLAVRQAQQGRWWAAVIAAGLSGLAHASAVLLIAPLAYAAWQSVIRERLLARHGRDRLAGLGADWLALLAPAAPLVGMATFLVWSRLAGLAGFTEMHSQGWSRNFHWPWQALRDFTAAISTTPLDPGYLALWMNIGVFFLVIALTVWSFRRIAWELWLFQLAALLFLLINYVDWNPLLSFFRLFLIVFPIYIEIALLGERKPWRLVIFTLSLLLALMCSALFFMWQGSMT